MTSVSKHRLPAWLRRFGTVFVLVGALALQACTVDLYTGLSQQQGNEVVAALIRKGIPAQRQIDKDGTVTVLVDKARFAEAMSVLDALGLPREKFETLGQIFKRDGLVSSPVQERAAMVFGLSQELSQTISDIDGVLSARVHLVLPENDPLKQQLVPSSASVFIRYRSSVDMKELVPQVKMLVANGVAGLTYDNVSVILVPVATPEEPVANEAGVTNFMGIWLRPDDVATVSWVFYGLVGLVLLLAGWLAYLHWRRRDVYALEGRAALPAAKRAP